MHAFSLTLLVHVLLRTGARVHVAKSTVLAVQPRWFAASVQAAKAEKRARQKAREKAKKAAAAAARKDAERAAAAAAEDPEEVARALKEVEATMAACATGRPMLPCNVLPHHQATSKLRLWLCVTKDCTE